MSAAGHELRHHEHLLTERGLRGPLSGRLLTLVVVVVLLPVLLLLLLRRLRLLQLVCSLLLPLLLLLWLRQQLLGPLLCVWFLFLPWRCQRCWSQPLLLSQSHPPAPGCPALCGWAQCGWEGWPGLAQPPLPLVWQLLQQQEAVLKQRWVARARLVAHWTQAEVEVLT